MFVHNTNCFTILENQTKKVDPSKQRGKDAAAELRKKRQEMLDEQKKLLDRKLQARYGVFIAIFLSASRHQWPPPSNGLDQHALKMTIEWGPSYTTSSGHSTLVSRCTALCMRSMVTTS